MSIVKLLEQHGDTQHAVMISNDHPLSRELEDHWRLVIGDELPSLLRPDGVSWCVDFRSGKTRRRASEDNRSQQPLARALGISKLPEEERRTWHVVDGTCGAGADGWQIAAAGASVTWVEQHPILFTLLESALGVARNDDTTQAIATHIHAVNNTIENVVEKPAATLHAPANAIYLDPMYPVRRSKAAVKKPMQFIQALVGKGPEPETMAMHCINALHSPDLKRVVVKRPSEAAPLIDASIAKAQLVSVDAGAARFDVYLKP